MKTKNNYKMKYHDHFVQYFATISHDSV